ncbi:MAG: peptidoglycan/LPS O-acetylase OafA/YrhL [Cocleimonas sp.]|jgi:peptidoglycan/LPS O-acetylase OafA/YrhL
MQLDQITFTRFIAALTVVFFHYGQSVFPANISFLFENVTAGPIAVGYFYVLSGFIMSIAYYQPDESKRENFNKTKYWIARFARIYPVYLLALLLIAAAKFRTLGHDWETLPLHLLLLQSWIPGYPITLNTPGWSLSVEAFFYLCFPFLLVWLYKRGIKSLAVFAVILWLITQAVLLIQLNSAAYAPKSLLHDFIYYNPLMHLNQFVMGLVCGVYLKNSKGNISNETKNGFWLLFSFTAMFLLIWGRPHLEDILGIKLAFTNGLLAPVFLAVIIFLAKYKGFITKLFTAPFLILLGEASYSLYILQKPIHGIYDKVIVPRIQLSDTLHFYIFVILLIITSIASFRFLETPMRKLINKRFA